MTAAEVVAALAALPGRIAGGDPVGVPVLTAIGSRTMELLAERFDALSVPRASYGPTGETWPDNAPATIARKLGRGPKNRAARRSARIQQGISKGSARNRPVAAAGYNVGIDTGRLRETLEPSPGGPTGRSGQVFRLERGAVVVGTADENAETFHKGVPDHNQLPRPIAPDDWPDAWRRAVGEVTGDAVAQVIVRTLGQ